MNVGCTRREREQDDGKRFDRGGEWRVEVVQLDDVDDEARTVPYTETRWDWGCQESLTSPA